jgi:signal-transduction protein with cAMP-binding, CBS, and nucleotidyltransferase domain
MLDWDFATIVAKRGDEGIGMHVRDGMSSMVLTVGLDPDLPGPGILTERDVLDSIGRGQDPDTEIVGDHLTSDVVYASPDWSLEEAAVAMVRGAFRHLIVCEQAEILGILSVRDVVRCWTDDGAICEVPESAAFNATA